MWIGLARQSGARWQRALMSMTLGIALTSGADGLAPLTPTEHRFAQVPCSRVDARCAVQPPSPSMIVLAAAPAADADLAALMRTPAPARGWVVSRAGGDWLLALGPLQAAEGQPTLGRWRLEDQTLRADVEYRPHDATAQVARRYVPGYGLLLVALPPLPAGAWQVVVQWHAAGGGATGEFTAGPLQMQAR